MLTTKKDGSKSSLGLSSINSDLAYEVKDEGHDVSVEECVDDGGHESCQQGLGKRVPEACCVAEPGPVNPVGQGRC